MSAVETAIEKRIEKHWLRIRQFHDLYEVERLANAGAERFGGEVSVRDWDNFAPAVQWTVVVDNFTQAAPMIEFIEDWILPGFALQCTGTQDYPTLNQRDFTFGPLVLTAVLRGDNAACRVVKVGERVEPILEFQCDGASS